jgi:hypothetical protein
MNSMPAFTRFLGLPAEKVAPPVRGEFRTHSLFPSTFAPQPIAPARNFSSNVAREAGSAERVPSYTVSIHWSASSSVWLQCESVVISSSVPKLVINAPAPHRHSQTVGYLQPPQRSHQRTMFSDRLKDVPDGLVNLERYRTVEHQTYWRPSSR